MTQAGSAARRLLDQLARSATPRCRRHRRRGDRPRHGRGADAGRPISSAVSPRSAPHTAAALRTGRSHALSGSPGPGDGDTGLPGAAHPEATGPPEAVPPVPLLRRQAAVLATAESAQVLEPAVRVGLDGRRTPPIQPRNSSGTPTWYRPPVVAAPRRQYDAAFGPVPERHADRAGAGRCPAGGRFPGPVPRLLGAPRRTHSRPHHCRGDLAAVRPALVGTLAGAVAAGTLLLVVGRRTDATRRSSRPACWPRSRSGRCSGSPGRRVCSPWWCQRVRPIAPASWQLAEARIVDVVTGSAIGLLCGLLAWPAGARREVRRTVAALLYSYGPLITGTVGVLLADPPGAEPPPPAYPALHRLRLAESAYLQYRSEPSDPRPCAMDWHAVLITANHILVGPAGCPASICPRPPSPRRRRLGPYDGRPGRPGAGRVAAAVLGRDRRHALPASHTPPEVPGDPPLPILIDLEQWLSGLTAELGHFERRWRPRSENGGQTTLTSARRSRGSSAGCRRGTA